MVLKSKTDENHYRVLSNMIKYWCCCRCCRHDSTAVCVQFSLGANLAFSSGLNERFHDTGSQTENPDSITWLSCIPIGSSTTNWSIHHYSASPLVHPSLSSMISSNWWLRTAWCRELIQLLHTHIHISSSYLIQMYDWVNTHIWYSKTDLKILIYGPIYKYHIWTFEIYQKIIYDHFVIHILWGLQFITCDIWKLIYDY